VIKPRATGPLRLRGVRFIVYGAGAIGGVLGADLARAGHEVVLIARGRHLAAIRRDGLRVRTPDGDRVQHLPAAESPGEIGWRPGDVALFAMKGQDTGPALRELAAHADPDTPVVCVQNGVANERAALRQFANVYGVCVMFPATHLAPGVVVAHSSPVPGLLDVGRYPAGLDDTAHAVAAAFRAAGFGSQPRPDVMRWKYRKLLTNLGNAVNAVYGPTAGAGPVADLVDRLRAEGETVLRAAGIDVATPEEDRQRRGDLLRTGPVEGVPRTGGSSWQSLARGTGTIEADQLNGEIVLLARLHGVAAPLNEQVRQLANRFARERREPGSAAMPATGSPGGG
jgi:2-dehydropantoate 2-reductase